MSGRPLAPLRPTSRETSKSAGRAACARRQRNTSMLARHRSQMFQGRGGGVVVEADTRCGIHCSTRGGCPRRWGRRLQFRVLLSCSGGRSVGERPLRSQHARPIGGGRLAHRARRHQNFLSSLCLAADLALPFSPLSACCGVCGLPVASRCQSVPAPALLACPQVVLALPFSSCRTFALLSHSPPLAPRGTSSPQTQWPTRNSPTPTSRSTRPRRTSTSSSTTRCTMRRASSTSTRTWHFASPTNSAPGHGRILRGHCDSLRLASDLRPVGPRALFAC